jgi:DNA-binding beta-propeller fold protein YncE
MEGLAYDWIGKNIFWTDNIRNSLEVVRYDGQHRKVILDDGDELLDRPRGIAVDPKKG